MKKIVKLLYATAVASFLAVSCDIVPQTDEAFKPGEPDLEDCAGIYFPEQENATDHIMDPADPTSFTFTVKRTNTDGALAVPVDVVANFEDVFQVAPIAFADGEDETTFKVDFPDAQIGVKYTCSIEVNGDQLVSKYSSNPAFMKFSVLREKWNELGMATYTDDVVTGLFGVQNVTYDVKVLENDLTKGLYRFIDMWGEAYPYNDPGDYVEGTVVEVDASDPNKVFIKKQDMGVDWGYGMMMVWSLADYYAQKGQDPSAYYGKLENGIITFPDGALLFGMKGYNSGAFYTANGDGAFKIKLPGAVEYDYSILVFADECEEGLVPVTVILGSDVAKAKYALAEGVLDEDGAAELAEQIAAGEVEGIEIAESGVYDVTAPETGKYTLVAATFDAAGEYQEADYVSFGYVKAGDSVPVVVSCTLETTSKWEARGYTSVNSLEFSICGEDLEDVAYGIYTAEDVEEYGMDAVEDDVYNYGTLVSAANLEIINTSVYSDLFIKLAPRTDYVLVVWASNGFESKYVTATCATEGLPSDWQQIGTGTFTYTAYMTGDDPGLPIWQDKNYPENFVIQNWFFGENFAFSVDEDNVVLVDMDQYTGYDHASYGPVYAGDASEYFTGYPYHGKYDAATSTFTFTTIYYVSAGYFGYVGRNGTDYEKFVIDGSVAPEAASVKSDPIIGSIVEHSANVKAGRGIGVKIRTAGLHGTPSVKVVASSATRAQRGSKALKNMNNSKAVVVR